MELTKCLVDYFTSTRFCPGDLNEYESLFDFMPLSVYWKDIHGRYLGRNRYAAEQMVLQDYESEFNIDYIKLKTDFDLYDYDTASIYRRNDIITLNDSNKTHYFVENFTLPSGDIVEQISIKRSIISEDNNILGTLACTINLWKYTESEKSLKDILLEKTLNRMRQTLIKFFSEKNCESLNEVCEIAQYIVYFYPNDHAIRKLLLLLNSELKCLFLLLKCFSPEKCAIALNTTTEFININIQNVKYKLNYDTEQDLLSWLWETLLNL